MTAHSVIAKPLRKPSHQWLAPTGLLFLSLIPAMAGAARLTELAGGGITDASSARFLDSPVPMVIHIVSVTIYSLLGAFQFVPSLRRRATPWHRVAGRILIPAGLLAAMSGLWMAVLYPHVHGYGDLIFAFRLVFGTAMLASMILGIRAIQRRNFVVHGEWMTRAYAIGLGAGTQALILMPGAIIFGTTQNMLGAVLMGVAWVINLALAETIIRHEPRRYLPVLGG